MTDSAFRLEHDLLGEFADIVKVGRTQLQDAVPMTLVRGWEATPRWSAKTAYASGRRQHCSTR